MPVTIGGQTLPCQFKYVPLIPEKRRFTQVTAAGVVVQKALNEVIGYGDIQFSMISDKNSAQILTNLYYDSSDTLTFVGYYGDVYEGYISKLEQPIEGGWVRSTGVFTVVCTTSDFIPSGC